MKEENRRRGKYMNVRRLHLFKFCFFFSKFDMIIVLFVSGCNGLVIFKKMTVFKGHK